MFFLFSSLSTYARILTNKLNVFRKVQNIIRPGNGRGSIRTILSHLAKVKNPMQSLKLDAERLNEAWVLVDEGAPFLETQCLSIVEAMDLSPRLYRVKMSWFWRYIPAMLIPNFIARVQATPKPLSPPWPSFVVCGGQVGLKLGRYLKNKHTVFTVALGSTSSPSFQKIIIESPVQGEENKQIVTFGPLHRIYSEGLSEARKIFYRKIDHLPKPRVGLFLRGDEPLEPLLESLTFLYKKAPFSLMIYGETLLEEKEEIFSELLKEIPYILWNGTGEDPYLGFLAHSEAIIVSNASSLMVAEATSAGKPLFIYCSSVLDPYSQALIQKGYAMMLTKDSSLFAHSSLPLLHETQRVADLLKEAYTKTMPSL